MGLDHDDPASAPLTDDRDSGGELATLRRRSARTERAEDEFARFFAQSLDLLCVASFDGSFTRVNPAWTTCLGWTREQLLATPFVEFVHPDDRDSTQAEVEKLAEGAQALLFENRYRHRDGSYRWLRWNARPVPGRRRIYATARDVTRQKRLESEIIGIVDRERERLGRELHDGLCQTLAGIAALSATLARKLAASSEPDASAAAVEIGDLLKHTIGQARDLARDLGPVGVDGADLDAALKTLALDVQDRFDVSCTLEEGGRVVALDREAEAHLFRIAQEAVSNAVRHGRAERIAIRLSARDGEGCLRVRDDGVGLPDDAHNRGGTGLHTMAYRARQIGGSLDVRRQTPRGTAVTCTFALLEASNTHENPDDPRDAR